MQLFTHTTRRQKLVVIVVLALTLASCGQPDSPSGAAIDSSPPAQVSATATVRLPLLTRNTNENGIGNKN